VKKRTQFAGFIVGKRSERRHDGSFGSIPFLGPLWLENPCGSAKFVTKNPKNAENFKEFHQRCVFRTSFIVSSVAAIVQNKPNFTRLARLVPVGAHLRAI
jgi:hypothetical protein